MEAVRSVGPHTAGECAEVDNSAVALPVEWDVRTENPLNWPLRRKYVILGLVSYIDLLTPLTSMMFAPGLPAMQEDFHSHDNTLATLALTVYVLGFSVGPLLFAPLSETHGRAIVYKGCLSMFLVFTIACAVSSSLTMLVWFRFIAGCFGAAPVAIGGAIVHDLFRVDGRGGAMALYQAGPILGNALGPPMGGLIIQYKSWRWVFWIVATLTAVALVCCLCLLEETHGRVILAKKSLSNLCNAQLVADERTPLHVDTPFPRAHSASQNSGSPPNRSDTVSELLQSFQMPLKLLFSSPVCAACSVVIALTAGTTNFVFASLGRIFQKQYDFSTSASGLIYLSVTIGFVLAAVIFGSTSDSVSRMLMQRYQGKRKPEFRLPASLIGLPLVAIGLACYGWMAQEHVLWIFPALGLGFIGIGITLVQLSFQTYLVDSFDDFAASALAATTVVRSAGGALVPLAGPLLYQRLGFGWGNSVMALVNLALCVVPWILFTCGSRWRENYSLSHRTRSVNSPAEAG